MAVDQATAGLLAAMAELGAKPLPEMTPQEARAFGAMLRDLSGPGPQMLGSHDEPVPTPDGSQIGVRVLVPAGEIRALVVYYHGGGWVIGSADEFDTVGRTLAQKLGAAVVLVDYRLAPEHRFPVAADDAWTALRWADQNMAGILGARVPLVVMGDSAGGNLSAVVARRARDEGGPAIDCQVLIYPVTDADLENETYLDPENQLMLTRESMAWFWNHYVPDPADRLHPDASPAQAANLRGLPAAIVVTAEHDVLRQEGESYADRLAQAGVTVHQRRFLGQMHGFFTMVNVLPASAEAIEFVTGLLGSRLSSERSAASAEPTQGAGVPGSPGPRPAVLPPTD